MLQIHVWLLYKATHFAVKYVDMACFNSVPVTKVRILQNKTYNHSLKTCTLFTVKNSIDYCVVLCCLIW
jgi:hypothetical protein